MKKIKNIFFIFLSIFLLVFIISNFASIKIELPRIENSLNANFIFENNFGKLYLKNHTYNFSSNLIKFNSLKKIELYNINIADKTINLSAPKSCINSNTFITFENLTSKIKLR